MYRSRVRATRRRFGRRKRLCGRRAHTANYERVCGGDTGHAEAIRITYDPARISYDRLLDVFFDAHDPTQLNRQGADVGSQYRSAIFYASEAERKAAEDKIRQLNSAKRIRAQSQPAWNRWKNSSRPRPIIRTTPAGTRASRTFSSTPCRRPVGYARSTQTLSKKEPVEFSRSRARGGRPLVAASDPWRLFGFSRCSDGHACRFRSPNASIHLQLALLAPPIVGGDRRSIRTAVFHRELVDLVVWLSLTAEID